MAQVRWKFGLVEFLLVLFIGCVIVIYTPSSSSETESGFTSSVTITDDGVPFERFCGLVVDVARGTIVFEDGRDLHIAYLFFEDADGKPTITKVLYGLKERLDTIKSGVMYDIGARKYDEGLSFPRRLDVVTSCPGPV